MIIVGVFGSNGFWEYIHVVCHVEWLGPYWGTVERFHGTFVSKRFFGSGTCVSTGADRNRVWLWFRLISGYCILLWWTPTEFVGDCWFKRLCNSSAAFGPRSLQTTVRHASRAFVFSTKITESQEGPAGFLSSFVFVGMIGTIWELPLITCHMCKTPTMLAVPT